MDFCSGTMAAGTGRPTFNGIRHRRCAGWFLACLFMLISGSRFAVAHSTIGYSHESSTAYVNTNWMAALPDGLPLSTLSIPGTHDSMSYQVSSNCEAIEDIVLTQSMDLATQLNAGIRVLDIRLRHIDDVFAIHHGQCFLNAFFGGDVMDVVNAFLDAHPTEAILMRVAKEYDQENITRSWLATFAWYMENYGSKVWTPSNPFDNPTLGDIRGKIVLLDAYTDWEEYQESAVGGLAWCDPPDGTCRMSIQDNYSLTTNFDLYDKWLDVKNQLDAAWTGALDIIYVNVLSGSGGSFPYFVASGHTNPATGAPRLWTGISTVDETIYPDFPRLDCLGELCSIYFEGTNVLAAIKLYFESFAYTFKLRSGIVMGDFFDSVLIHSVIQMNPLFEPPNPDAGGPYLAFEGTAIAFDASASTDPNSSALEYRWDFENDGSYDTGWSNSPMASHAWHDDWTGEAKVAVRNSVFETTARADVTVLNVAPSITATGDTVDENGLATVSGTITDPGNLDSFEVVIDWGEGLPVSYNYGAGSTSYSEQHQYLDDNPGGTDSDSYDVDVTVIDDNSGSHATSTTVTVNNVSPVVSILDVTDESGESVGTGILPVLVNTTIDLEGDYSDVGTLDTHTGELDWDDGNVDNLGAAPSNISAFHMYSEVGLYSVVLVITDDDTGSGSDSRSITVIGALQGIGELMGQLQSYATDPTLDPGASEALGEALLKLSADNGENADAGALELLDMENLNAAMVKLWQAMQYLESAEAADPSLDLTASKDFLALIAKSVAATAISHAKLNATKPKHFSKIAEAENLVDAGDQLLAIPDHLAAIDTFREALQKVQSFL